MSETTGEVGTTTPETAVEPRRPSAVTQVPVARLDAPSLPTDPRAGVLVLPHDPAFRDRALIDAAPAPEPAPVEFLVAPGPAAAAWQAACDAGTAAVEQPVAGPLGCLLAADGLVAPAGALAEILARGSWRPSPGAGGLVALAYALTETGLVPRVTTTRAPGAAPPAAAPALDETQEPDAAPDAAELAAVARQVPVLRALRRVTGRRWARPVLHVVVGPEPVGREEMVSLVDRWLSSSVEDLVVSVPHSLPEYDVDPRVLVAGSDPLPTAPFLLRWPASLAPGMRTAAGLLDVALRHGCGLVRVRTAGREETPSLTRAAVVARLARTGVTEPDVADYQRAAGTWWADGGHLGVTTTAGLPPGPVAWERLDTDGWRRIRALEAEVARLTASGDVTTAAKPGGRRRRWRPRGRT